MNTSKYTTDGSSVSMALGVPSRATVVRESFTVLPSRYESRGSSAGQTDVRVDNTMKSAFAASPGATLLAIATLIFLLYSYLPSGLLPAGHFMNAFTAQSQSVR